MEQNIKSKLAELRIMESAEAADWLITNCPIGSERSGEAFLIISRLSWKKSDQRRLAEHYLSKVPYASAKPYEAFASIMQTEKLVDVIEGFIPSTETDRDLLRYHLAPVLSKSAKSDADRKAVDALLSKI